MGRAIKILLTVIIAIVVLLAAAVFVVTQVIDPNQFKPEIEKQAATQANLQLDIQGDLAWQFWPSLGVSIGRTEARIVDEEDLFAALDEAQVSVAVWPLLFGQVEMDGVTLAGLEVNLKETAEGGNWEQIGPQNEEPAAEEPEKTAQDGEKSLNIPVTIPSVNVSDGRLRYKNTTDGTDIVVEHFNLAAEDVNPDEPFPLQLSLRYQDQSDTRVDLNLDTVLAADLDAQHFVLSPMTLQAAIAGLTTQPVDVKLEQNLDLNLTDDTAKITDLVLHAAGTETRGHATVSNLTADLALAGEIETAPFDVNKAFEAIGETPIETADSKALSNVALKAKLAGPPNSVMANPLTVTLDDSTLTGKAGLESLDTGKIVFDLNLDRIVLDGYLPPESEDKDTPSAAPGGGKKGGRTGLSEAEIIPVEALRPLNAAGKLAIGNLKYDTIEAQDLKLALSAKDGLIKITQISGQTLDGSFNANATLDVTGNTPRIQAKHQVSNIQIQPLVQLAVDKDLAKGIFTTQGSLQASGNSQKALVESAKGTMDLQLSDAILRGMNLYNTLIGGVNGMLGRFQGLTALIPSGKIPRELNEDTKILDLTSKARLEQNVAYLDSLDAALEKGTVSGKGWMNVLNQDFDMTLGMQSPELGGSEYLEGATWPIRCEGNLSGKPAKWCGPDKAGFQKIAKGAAAKATQKKLQEKLGIEGEGDTTEEVLKDAAGKKAKQELNKQIQEGLKGLFD